MSFKLIYTDPKKKRLQLLEIVVMVIALPIGLYYGAGAHQEWSAFRTAQAYHVEASELVHNGNYEEGIPKLKQALEAYPEYYSVWEELAVSYHMLGDHEKELETYKAATEALPENGSLHRELATAYHELGQHKKELASAELAVTLPSSDALFTGRVLERAQKEASGEIPTEPLDRPHTHEGAGSEAEQVADEHESAHDHDHHDYD